MPSGMRWKILEVLRQLIGNVVLQVPGNYERDRDLFLEHAFYIGPVNVTSDAAGEIVTD